VRSGAAAGPRTGGEGGLLACAVPRGEKAASWRGGKAARRAARPERGGENGARDNPPCSVPLLLLYKKNSIISPHAKDFIDMVKEYYRNLEEKKIKA